jgi:hypothetical protein
VNLRLSIECHLGEGAVTFSAVVREIALVIATVAFGLGTHSVSAKTPSSLTVAACKLAAIETDARPDPEGTPTSVSIGLRLVDVTEIEDVSQSIAADFVLVQSWTDPRLAAFEGCRYDLAEVWTPRVDVLNSGRLFTRLPRQVEVLRSGQVRYVQRYRGSLVFPYQARHFPFDQHDIIISLLCIECSTDDVVLAIDEDITGRVPYEFNVPDWKIDNVSARIEPEFFEIYDRNVSRYDFHVSVERRSGYYVGKVILPLIFIVAMSWTVFWVDPTKFGPQIGTSTTSMLTLIAYQFLIGSELPRLSYFTTLDQFIVGSTILVFLALMESVATSYLVANDKTALARRLDRTCRWAFPLAFLALSGVVFL